MHGATMNPHPHTHGIRSDAEIFRRAMSSETHDLSEIKSSMKRPVALSVDTFHVPPQDGQDGQCGQGGLNVAYLLGNSVFIFRAILDHVEQRLVLLKSIQLEDMDEDEEECSNNNNNNNNNNINNNNNNKWTGVALAGEFLVVWGTTGKGTRSLVRLLISIQNQIKLKFGMLLIEPPFI